MELLIKEVIAEVSTNVKQFLETYKDTFNLKISLLNNSSIKLFDKELSVEDSAELIVIQYDWPFLMENLKNDDSKEEIKFTLNRVVIKGLTTYNNGVFDINNKSFKYDRELVEELESILVHCDYYNGDLRNQHVNFSNMLRLELIDANNSWSINLKNMEGYNE